ncbi:MAG: S8 family serine peptidase [Ezakiella sp.]|nr:S8 family serine peptidase [Ezakiella sp.]
MNKKLTAILLAVFMAFSMFVGYDKIFANELKTEYLVYVDVENIVPGYNKAMENNKLKKAMEIADEALDKFEKILLENAKSADIFGRIELVTPFVAVRLNATDLEVVKSLPNVTQVIENLEFEIKNDVVKSDEVNFQDRSDNKISLMMTKSNDLIGNTDLLQSKYDGRGSVLGIIDSNMDPSHEAFYLSNPETARFQKDDIEKFVTGGELKAKGTDVEEFYHTEKVPFGWNYYLDTQNLNPDEELEAHGQHVSGTVAGNRVLINGKTWRGVAPEAQLLMMNVMKNGSTSSFVYVKAMQDAILMGADAVNMSLGATKGLPGNTIMVDKFIDKGYNLDTNFVIAAGNEGEYKGNLNIDYPDFGTMASPGTATNAITVASLENKSMYTTVFSYEGKQYAYSFARDKKDTEKSINFEEKDYEFVDCGEGKPEDFTDKEVAGKIALIKRGGLTFTQKILNAEKVGAAGVIIYNNAEGLIGLAIEGTSIPSASVTLEVGEILKAGNTNKIHIYTESKEMPNPEYGEMSAFSNWGLSAGGYMKPDITAPGGHIYSTQTMGNTFGDMSGTSMATPHVTGGVGVIRERLKEPIFSGVEHKAALTKTILMNSAVPHMDPKTKQKTSPRRQGAGIMNLTKASELDFTVVDAKTKIASKFVGDVDDTITLNLLVHNYSMKEKTIVPSVETTIEAHDGKTMLLRPGELFSNTYEEQTFTVPAGSEKEVTITMPIENMELVKPFTNGAYIEGFLHLRDQNGMEVCFPFVSFKGEYGKIPSIEKPIYNYDFETEAPIYWNYEPKENFDWFNYSTHLETNMPDAEGKQRYVIAGMKNFDEVSELKNQEGEPKPEFEKMYFSPNGDGYLDSAYIYIVAVRNGKFGVKVFDENGKETNFGNKLLSSNISAFPDEAINGKPKDRYTGFNILGGLPLSKYEDGNYTLKLTGASVKESGTFYDETSVEIPFSVDTTKPEMVDTEYDESTGALSFKVKEEGAGLKNIKIYNKDKEIEFTEENGIYSLIIPQGEKLSNIKIEAMDNAYNLLEITAEMMLFKDMFGKLKVETKTDKQGNVNLVYEVHDENGEKLDNIDNIKFGKYKLVVKSYSEDFELVGEEEVPFEISKENKEVTITLEFKFIERVTISVNVTDKSDVNYSDIEIFATNTNTGKVYQFVEDPDDPILAQYFNAKLPYGDYNLSAKLKDGIEGYDVVFDTKNPITVGREDDYHTVSNLRVTKVGAFKVNITQNGYEGEIEYKAKNPDKGDVVDMNHLGEGTWIIFPTKVPQGYYLEDPMQIAVLEGGLTTADVTFTFEKIDGKEFELNITDNHEGAKYEIGDFYEYIGEDGKYFYYEKGMKLPPGFYYAYAVPDKFGFGETVVDGEKKQEVTFKSATDPVNLEFNWKEYKDLSEISEGIIMVKDESVPEELRKSSYNFVFTDSYGKSVNHEYVKASPQTMFVNLPYGYYTATIENMPEGYELAKNEFAVSGKEFFGVFTLKKKVNEGEVMADFHFMDGEKEILPVKFKLGDEVYTDSKISVKPGTYTIELLEPIDYKVKSGNEEVTVPEVGGEIYVPVEQQEVPDDKKGTITVKVYEVNGENRVLQRTPFVYIGNEYVMDSKPHEYKFGTYLVTLSPYSWNSLGKYDETKSKIKETVVLDENHKDVVVELEMVVKGGDTPTPVTKGKAKWNYEYSGTKYIYQRANLVKVGANGDELIKSRVWKDDFTELEFGKYAFILENFSTYDKLEADTHRIEFELTKENPEFTATFKIKDKAEAAKMQKMIVMSNQLQSADKVTFKVFDADGKEVPVTKTASGFEFPAIDFKEYTLEAEGNDYPFFPNVIKALTLLEKQINFTPKLDLTVKSIANGKEIKAKYRVSMSNSLGKAVTEDLSMIPFVVSAEKQIYTIEFLSCEEGYHLAKNEDAKKIIEVSEQVPYSITFNFEGETTPAEPVNKEALKKLVEEYDEIIETDEYKEADDNDKKAYDDLIEKAEDMLNENATQTEVDALVKSIEDARDKMIENVLERAKEKLKKLLDEADDIKGSDAYNYDDEIDKKAYDDAIANATAVIADKRASLAELKRAEAEILNAKSALNGVKPVEPTPELEPTPDVKPEKPEKDVKYDKSGSNAVSVVNNDTTVQPIVETPNDFGIVELKPILPVDLTDIPSDSTGEAIRNMVSKGVLKGMENDKFEGDITISRAMVAEVLMRISIDKLIDETLIIPDIKLGDWYEKSAKWAISHEIFKGFDDGTFRGNTKVTREQFALIIYRFLKEKGIELPEIINDVYFEDMDKISAWSKDAVIAMAKVGIVNPQKGNVYNPTSEVTRAELADALNKIISFVEAQRGY